MRKEDNQWVDGEELMNLRMVGYLHLAGSSPVPRDVAR